MSSIRIARMLAASLTAFGFLGCSDEPSAKAPERSRAGSEKAAAAPPSLYGRWRIVEVNGAPARSLAAEAGLQPNVSFKGPGYGGSTGCNSFGGTGLLVAGRWFADSPMATQQGCGELTEQERGVFGVLAGGPQVVFEGPAIALLRTATGALRLARIGPAPAQPPDRPGMQMAGTRWDLHALDGAAIDPPGRGNRRG